jgi:hypothetical protein
MCETIPSRLSAGLKRIPLPGRLAGEALKWNLTWIASGSVKVEMGGGAYLVLARGIGTSVHLSGRGFETSERGSLCHATILSFRPSPPLPPGMGYLGAKARRKQPWLVAALAFFVIGASVSPLFRALMINTHCGQFSVSVVVEPRW